MKKCPNCNRVYHDYDFYCLNDNYRLIDYPEEIAFKEQEEIRKNKNYQKNHISSQSQPNIPKCPTCGSTNIKRISVLNRVAHGYAFGLFSKTAHSQFCCQNCGYKF